MSFAAVAAVAGLASAAVGAMGSIQQGRAQEAASQYEADLAERNATIVRQQSGVAEEQQRRHGRAVLGTQRAGVGEAGIDLSSGSAFDLYREAVQAAEQDALTIRYDGELQTAGLLTQRNAARANAGNAKSAGYLTAGAQLLSGVGSYAGDLFQSPGATPGRPQYRGNGRIAGPV